MHDTATDFHGSYRYSDRATLERMLARARAELGTAAVDDELRFVYFVTNNALTVHVTIPSRAHSRRRLAAANVFLILAHGAIEGAVGTRPSLLPASDARD